MTNPTDLDTRLTAMFAAQEQALRAPLREWTDLQDVREPAPRIRRHRVYALGLAGFAAMLALVAVSQQSADQRVTTGGPPAAGGAPTTAAIPAAGVLFETKQVSLAARAITIDIDGKTFTTTTPMEVSGDPGDLKYQTLELVWREHDTEMRMSIYLQANDTEWWSNEIRTYDGTKPGEWAYYRGDFFRSPLNAGFVGDFESRATGEEGSASGRLRMTGLRLEAFRRPAACTNPQSPYTLQAGADGFAMTLPGPGSPEPGYGVAVTLLDTATCRPVPAPADFNYRWTTENPAIVAVRPDGPRADIQALGAGATFVSVAAIDRTSGQVAAETKVKVDVNPAGQGPAQGSAVIVDGAPPKP